MTTLNEARAKIYSTFIAEYALSAFTFDNEDFDPPAGAPWVWLVVRHITSQQESLGGVGRRKFDRPALLIASVFVPLDQGTTAADNLVTAIRDIYEGRTLTPENVRFNAGSPREIGEDGSYFQMNVELQFSYTERK